MDVGGVDWFLRRLVGGGAVPSSLSLEASELRAEDALDALRGRPTRVGATASSAMSSRSCSAIAVDVKAMSARAECAPRKVVGILRTQINKNNRPLRVHWSTREKGCCTDAFPSAYNTAKDNKHDVSKIHRRPYVGGSRYRSSFGRPADGGGGQ